jgi:spermidine synthase
MRKYGGVLIYEGRDDHGVIEVVDDSLERSLHFGTPPKQSSMLLSSPLHLVLSYTRAMVAPLLFLQGEPRRVLLVGLGGGSLAKFFLQHFPRCHVDVVELRSEVERVARSHFHLPDSPRLHVEIADAGEFMKSAPLPEFGAYQMILIDAFAATGIAKSVSGLHFFESCRERLAQEGIIAVNLWARDSVGLGVMIDTMRDGLDTSVLRLPIVDKDNIIALAGNFASTRRTGRLLSERARDFQSRYEVEFPAFLRVLRYNNPAQSL